MPTNLGRQPDLNVGRSQSCARLAVPRPNHDLTTVVGPLFARAKHDSRTLRDVLLKRRRSANFPFRRYRILSNDRLE
jgi:hypothetical protein